MIVQGACAWWAAAVRGIEPIILSFGAAFAAIGINDHSSHDVQLFKSKEWFKFKSEKADDTEDIKSEIFKGDETYISPEDEDDKTDYTIKPEDDPSIKDISERYRQ